MSLAKIRSLIFLGLSRSGMLLLAFLPQVLGAQLLRNPSFEMPHDVGLSEFGWMICEGDPDSQVLDGHGPGVLGIHTEPAQGNHYIGMLATDQGGSEAIGQAVDLEAGSLYYGSIALFRSMSHQNWDGTGQVQIWGGSNCNDVRELLWSSGTVGNLDNWETFPIAFAPLSNHEWLSIMVTIDAGSGQMTYICLDDLKLSDTYFAVDFLGFAVEPQAGAAYLSWETVPLQDNLRFDVTWSQDGEVFEPVGSLEAFAGNSKFSFTHSSGSLGRQYYRISTVDRGGHENQSEVRTIVVAGSGVAVFPNPVVQRFTVSLGETGTVIDGLRLLDVHGRECKAWEGNGLGQMSVEVPVGLVNGCYFLQVAAGKVSTTHRLLIGQ